MDEADFFSSNKLPAVEEALLWQAKLLAELVSEMGAFEPVPTEQYKSPRCRVWMENASHEERREAELEVMVEDPPDCSPEAQFEDVFFDRLNALEAMVVLTSHAACEALINAILTIADAKESKFQDTNANLTFLRKWQIAPRSIVANYTLPSPLERRLRRLQRSRNAVAHAKTLVWSEEPECDCDGDCADVVGWLREFLSFVGLPYDLQRSLRRQTTDLELGFFIGGQLQRRDELDRTLAPVRRITFKPGSRSSKSAKARVKPHA